MAQGKLSNRQKMINLMYLIFIAMLAMNIDQEVLRSFASINETLTDVSVQTKASNENLYNAVEKQNDAASVAKAKEVKQKVDSFVAYVEGIKNVIAIKAKSNDEALNYNVLESSDKLNKLFFENAPLGNTKAQEFQKKVEEFRNYLLSFDKYKPEYAAAEKAAINKFFSTTADRKTSKNWLVEKFYNQPAIASLSNLSALQMNARNQESKMISNLITGAVVIEQPVIATPITNDVNVSTPNYTPPPPVNNNTTNYNAEDKVQVLVAPQFGALYVGLDQTVGVSVSGANASSIKMSASSGSLSGSGGSYTFKSGTVGPITLTISGQTATGKPFTETVSQTVRPVPPPTSRIQGMTGGMLPAQALANGTVDVIWRELPIKATVASFSVKVPGKMTITCQGNRMSGEAAAAISSLRTGQTVQIFDIKASVNGTAVKGSNITISVR